MQQQIPAAPSSSKTKAKPGVRSQKGMALMVATFALLLMAVVISEITYDTSVDYVVANHQVNRVKAYFAAKSAVELSLLRIMLYKQAVVAFGDSLGANKGMLDPIWSFPFMWPPTMMDKMTEVDKSGIQDVVKESYMGSQYAVSISPEGGKLDINDLGSDVKALKTSMINQIIKVFESKVEHDEEFAKEYRGYNWKELVNNIADYIDEDKQGLNGGDESSPYRDHNEPGVEMPPNRGLRTVDELHMVGGMTDAFYDVLAPRITVYGTKGVNVNFADKDTLMSLDISMTEEAVTKAIARRSNPKEGGPFKNEQDFLGFLNNYGVNVKAIQESKVPLLFDIEFNFRIQATGLSQNVKRDITVVTYDFPNLANRFAEMLDKQWKEDNPGGGDPGGGNPGGGNPGGSPGGGNPQGANSTAADAYKKIQGVKGRPTVVSWEEN